ncbi:ribonuclease P protein subunit p20 [Oratosquilla oratoria]|uniref:ribonuclease P protein subunit p20 n=1 Tax=Oratosquilla oratoria TaxID=337810 RepID=UPI003F75F05C
MASKEENAGVNVDEEEGFVRRRLPRHLPKRYNDIYVNNNSNFKSQLQRGLTVLKESGCVLVHGLGAAVPRAINLAQSLQDNCHGEVTLDIRTGTVTLTEDLQWVSDGTIDPQTKNSSSIHIKVNLNIAQNPNIAQKTTDKCSKS